MSPLARSPNEARLIEPRSEQADFETRRHNRLLACRATRYPHPVRKRGAEVRSRQVRGPDVPAQARPVGAPIRESGATLELLGDLLGALGHDRAGANRPIATSTEPPTAVNAATCVICFAIIVALHGYPCGSDTISLQPEQVSVRLSM